MGYRKKKSTLTRAIKIDMPDELRPIYDVCQSALDEILSTHGLHYRVVPPPLRWRGTLGQPKAGGLFFNQSKFWLDNGAAAWYTRGVNQSRRI